MVQTGHSKGVAYDLDRLGVGGGRVRVVRRGDVGIRPENSGGSV
jgi:hypothetical protein